MFSDRVFVCFFGVYKDILLSVCQSHSLSPNDLQLVYLQSARNDYDVFNTFDILVV